MSDNGDQTPQGGHRRAREWRIVGIPYETMSDSEALRCVLPAVDESLLAEMGLVQRPECDRCGGWRVGCMHEGRFSPQHCADATVPCPKCGGSGYLPMVVLDMDVEALREMSEQWDRFGLSDDNLLLGLARQVLAALDGEEA